MRHAVGMALDFGMKRTADVGRTEGITVLLADPDPIVRSTLASILTADPAITRVVAVSTPSDAIRRSRRLEPEVAVVSEWFPGPIGGVELTRELRRGSPATLVLLLAVPSEIHDVLAAVRAGARGYLLKSRDMTRLARTVRRAAQTGFGPFSPPLTEELLRALSELQDQGNSSLTDREAEVVRLVGKGLANQQIADQLCVSVATVKSHLHSAMRKYGVTSRLQLGLSLEHGGAEIRRQAREESHPAEDEQ